MDPLGFALENFSAVGQYRADDPDTHTPIDATGVLPDGTAVEGPSDLRQALGSASGPVRADLHREADDLRARAGGTDYRDMPTVRAHRARRLRRTTTGSSPSCSASCRAMRSASAR